jgi:hypothetical protein
MSDTIQFNLKPIKTATSFEGTVDLDELYKCILEKTQNGSIKYVVLSISDEAGNELGAEDSRYAMIEKSVIKWAEKNGIGT